VYGAVVDTTAGSMTRVGTIYSTSLTKTDPQVKWVWSDLLVEGRTYMLALFVDQMKSQTCVPTTDSGFLHPIVPAIPTPKAGDLSAIPVTGDCVQKFAAAGPIIHYDSMMCSYFPAGPIADAVSVPSP
jgi:hypothetical protein